MQLAVFSSGIQIAGTQCSTLPRSSVGSAFRLFFIFEALVPGLASRRVAIRSSEGGNGSACSERRRWFVEDDDVSVELGCVTLRETRSCDLACRMTELHSSLSSSVADTPTLVDVRTHRVCACLHITRSYPPDSKSQTAAPPHPPSVGLQ